MCLPFLHEQGWSWTDGWWSNLVTCAWDSDLSVSLVEAIGQGLMAIQSSYIVINSNGSLVLIQIQGRQQMSNQMKVCSNGLSELSKHVL